ncbi:MAG: CvpA family protein [Gammaproteobacteria bacterium]
MISALVGIFRGLVREALSLIIWVLAIWIAARFGDRLAHLFANLLGDPLWQLWAGRLAVFLGVLFVGSLVAWLIGYVVSRSVITGTDRMLGMLFGLARGVVLAGLLVLALEIGGFGNESWWRESKLIPYAAAVGAELRSVAQEQLAERAGVRL